ncbi:two-partner secretion domain-containing protein [Nostoc sp.]|uniref:two-partner secretion domain-containing protein n=1 Tax=Nostoc sp. TaxID=1180 RepID=UPI003B6069B3
MVEILRFGLRGLLVCVGALAVSIPPTFAQLTPDNTLGKERSQVIPINTNNDRIEGGAARGTNLFHSFQDFNVGVGRGVYFTNPQGITNIFSRVTGSNSSNIFGKLGVLGDANLFLLNPNGILFGKNASLDVQGSFLGTTANGVQFGNQGVFSATNPQAPPLLTINPSALFFNQINQNASIQNNSIAPAGKDPGGVDVFGLRVPDGKSLLLVGGNVSMDGGWAIANGGRIELGGLVETGSIGIQSNGDNFSLSFPDGVQRGDISLTNKAIVGVIAGSGGSITANARNLEILAGSQFFAGIGSGLGTVNTQAGDITVDATGKIKLAGANSLIFNSVQSQAVGNAGNITIKTGSLEVTDGAQIVSSTFGKGDSGNISITASDAISLDKTSYIVNNVQSGDAEGNTGNIDITTGSLSVTNGAQINSITRGQGNAGNITIQAKDAVPNGLNISGIGSRIFSGTDFGGVGRGGNINIQAGEVVVKNVGSDEGIASSSYGKGDAGDITINTRSLIVRNSQLGATVYGEGNAGNFQIIASDSVELSGEIPGNEKGFPGGILAQLDMTGKGKGGNVYIETGRLSVSDGSKVQAATFGEGNAGSLLIRADEIDIFNTGKPHFYGTGIFSGVQLDPRTVKLPQGNGGDLRIETRNLSLRNGGEIGSSTSGKGDSGNISITASDAISLNASSYIYNNVQSNGAVGNAGKIDITTGSLSVTNGAQINSFTSGQGNAGNITIQARDAVSFDGVDSDGYISSGSFSSVGTGAVGNGGNINITAGSLSLTNNGQLGVNVRGAFDIIPAGEGIGGTVDINVRDAFTISGTGSGIFASLGSGAVGQSGDVKVEAGNVFVTDGGKIVSSTFGKGDSGNISIIAREAISLDKNGIYNNVESSDAEGNAGKIDITTGSLSVTNGAQIDSFTRGRGNAGNITIQARDAVTFDGVDSDGFPSTSFSGVETGAVGNGGNINITASSLSLTNSGTLGVSVDRASEELPGGQGIGGNININVRDAFTISGTDSGIDAFLGAGAIGRGGDIKVEAGNIFVTDGGKILSSTFGKGDSGNISITAIDAISLEKNGIYSNVQSRDAEGNAGKIDITTGSLSVTNGAQINSFTRGRGNAGNITIQARDAVTFDGSENNENYSALSSSVLAGAVGNGGNIDINAGSLFLNDRAFLASAVYEKSEILPGGEGNGGTININVRDAFTISGTGSSIFASLGSGAIGRGGDIKVEAGNIFVTDGGKIVSSTFGKGDSGNISITAREAISLDKNGIYNNVESSDAEGNAGKIDITTGSLSVTNGANINSFTRGRGNAGNITIQARDAVTFDGVDSDGFPSTSFSGVETGAVGNGGNINITASSLSLTNSGTLGVSVDRASEELPGGQGIGGNININVRDAFTISGTDSGIDAFLGAGAVGQSGDVKVEARNLFIKDDGAINSSTFGKGNGGNITVEAKDLVEILSDSLLNSSVQEGATGNAGDITIKTGRLIVKDSQIGNSVLGEGNAGALNIIASESVELSGQIHRQDDAVGSPGGLLTQIDPLGKGRAGNLTIETRRLSVSDGSKIQAATFGDGDAGNIFIHADEIDLFETEKPNFFNTGIFAGVQTDGRVDAGIIDPRNGRPPKGQGGNLTIATKKLSLRDGAEVFVETTGDGDAGKLLIRASESVNVTGVSKGSLERQRSSEITAGASQRSTGNGGSLTIETPLLNVADGGIISSSSLGKGTAGDINITADVARLNNSQITAQTASTDGGNINFNLSQYLLLRNHSQISTTAGTAQAGGNGGNININSKFIMGIPEENSDISANAYTGTGGKVQINSQGIFGIESRPKPTDKSDITASSALGVSGVIKINTPDTTSIQNSFTGLSPNVIDTNALIANSCVVRSPKQDGTFFITGSGALRNSPGGASISIYSTGEVRNIDDNTSRTWKKGNRIVEPQGVYRLADGRLVLSRECD